MLSDSEPIEIYNPAHPYNSENAEAAHTMPAGHPKGIYEVLANIYKETAKSIRDENLNLENFRQVHDGVRGMKFIHSVVNSNRDANVWVEII